MRYSIYGILVLTSCTAIAVWLAKLIGISVMQSMLVTLVAFAPTVYFLGACLLKSLTLPQRGLVFLVSLLLTLLSCFLAFYFGIANPRNILQVFMGLSILWGVQTAILLGCWAMWQSGQQTARKPG